MKICCQCGADVTAKRNKARIFCSKDCFQKSRRKVHIRTCKKCGKHFILKNIADERRGKGKYCSRQCSKYATKTHEFNESFFNIIDTQEKAYWLGFIFADGNNSMDELSIELSDKDTNHLKSLKIALNATQEVSFRTRLSFNKRQRSAQIRFSSRPMCKQLFNLGCIPNKSKTVKYPKIPIELNRHFIRGLFDGDGCINLSKTCHHASWSIYSASIDMAKQLKSILEKETKCKICFYSGNNGYTVAVGNKNTISTIYHYLYGNESICLKRKEEIWNRFLT